MRVWIQVAAILFGGGFLHAESPMIGLDVLEKARNENQYAVFAGESARLLLAVDAPKGVELKLKGDLFQIGGDLAIPLSSEFSPNDSLRFENRTRLLTERVITFPMVKRTTRMILRIQAAGASSASVIRKVPFTVYPMQHLKSFKAALDTIRQQNGTRLAIMGKSPAIRSFLKANDISFEEAGEEPPATFEPNWVYLSQQTKEQFTRLLPDLRTGRCLIFVTGSPLLDGVYHSPSGHLTKVTLPILENLSTNPQSQQTFAFVVEQALGIANSSSDIL